MASWARSPLWAWPPRLGWRSEAVGIGVLTAAVGASLAAAQVTAAAAPGTAAAYRSAMTQGDATGAWSAVRVDRSKLGPEVDARLLTEQGLAAMLSTTKGRSAPVVAPAKTPTRTFLGLLSVGGYRVRPAAIALVLSSGESLAIDGIPVPVRPGRRQVFALWPGQHRVVVRPGPLFQVSSQVIAADSPYPAEVAIQVRRRLTPAALSRLVPALSHAFASCIASVSAAPPGCPQKDSRLAGQDVSWRLLGDPAGGASWAPGPDGNLIATGHYQMTATPADADPASVSSEAVGGPFRALLRPTGAGQMSVGFLGSGRVPPALRPALADSRLFAAVRARFQACLAASVLAPAGCPQRAFGADSEVADVRWSSSGDPITQAAVTFDNQRALFVVSGTFRVKVDYRGLNPYQAAIPRHEQVVGRFRADLFWDGAKLVLVDFEPPA